MPRTSLLALPLLPLLLIAGGCAPAPEGTRGNGVLLTADGRLIGNTDTNHRAEIATHIREELEKTLGAGWTVEVAIVQLPRWIPSQFNPDDGDWKWDAADVTVTLRGAGTPPRAVAELRDGVVEYLAKKVQRPADNLRVTVNVAAPAATVSTTTPPPPIPDPRPPHSGPRTYRVQPGDTLADIATLFYGSPAPWRRIVAANPGLDPAALQPGQELVIPPAETPAAPAPAPAAPEPARAP